MWITGVCSFFLSLCDIHASDYIEKDYRDITTNPYALKNTNSHITIRCYAECGVYSDFKIIPPHNTPLTWGDVRRSMYTSLVNLFKTENPTAQEAFFKSYWENYYGQLINESWSDHSIRLEFGMIPSKIPDDVKVLDKYLNNQSEAYPLPYYIWDPMRKS